MVYIFGRLKSSGKRTHISESNFCAQFVFKYHSQSFCTKSLWKQIDFPLNALFQTHQLPFVVRYWIWGPKLNFFLLWWSSLGSFKLCCIYKIFRYHQRPNVSRAWRIQKIYNTLFYTTWLWCPFCFFPYSTSCFTKYVAKENQLYSLHYYYCVFCLS